MKVLVTGASGQIGSELIRRSSNFCLDIVAANRSELDISIQSEVEQYVLLKGPDAIVNAAAYTAVDLAESEQKKAYDINCEGVKNLAEVCLKNNIPLFHISTDYVFNGDKAGGYVEEDIPDPNCIYGKSKLEGDLAVESILEQYIILRVSWVFGALGNNFVRTMLRLAKEVEYLKIVSDQHGCPTWAGTIADTLLLMIDRYRIGNIPWGTYHYSSKPQTTWYEFAVKIFEEAHLIGLLSQQPKLLPIDTNYYSTKARRPLNSVLDSNKLNQEFGIDSEDWLPGLQNVLKEWNRT